MKGMDRLGVGAEMAQTLQMVTLRKDETKIPLREYGSAFRTRTLLGVQMFLYDICSCKINSFPASKLSDQNRPGCQLLLSKLPDHGWLLEHHSSSATEQGGHTHFTKVCMALRRRYQLDF